MLDAFHAESQIRLSLSLDIPFCFVCESETLFRPLGNFLSFFMVIRWLDHFCLFQTFFDTCSTSKNSIRRTSFKISNPAIAIPHTIELLRWFWACFDLFLLIVSDPFSILVRCKNCAWPSFVFNVPRVPLGQEKLLAEQHYGITYGIRLLGIVGMAGTLDLYGLDEWV